MTSDSRLQARIAELERQLAASEKAYQQERDQRIACGEHNAELEAERDEALRQLAECQAKAAAWDKLTDSALAEVKGESTTNEGAAT